MLSTQGIKSKLNKLKIQRVIDGTQSLRLIQISKRYDNKLWCVFQEVGKHRFVSIPLNQCINHSKISRYIEPHSLQALKEITQKLNIALCSVKDEHQPLYLKNIHKDGRVIFVNAAGFKIVSTLSDIGKIPDLLDRLSGQHAFQVGFHMGQHAILRHK